MNKEFVSAMPKLGFGLMRLPQIDGEIDIPLVIYPFANRFHVAIIHVYKFRVLRDPCVSFHCIDFRHLRRLFQRLNNGVFSTAVSDHQNVHILLRLV